jgi:hypothetical protein
MQVKAPIGEPGRQHWIVGWVVVVVVGALVLVVVGDVVVVLAAVVEVVAAVVVVTAWVVVVVGSEVVVVVAWQTKAPPVEPAPHESQQLAAVPAHACPPFGGALHWLAFDLIEHFTLPRLSTRQQVMAPGLPHVELAAQRTTLPLQLLGRSPDLASSFATWATQLTY